MSTTSIRRVLAASALFVVATALPAMASTTLSPNEVLADIDVTLTLRTTTDAVDLTTQVSATFPEAIAALACGAPDGWSCSIGSGQATWTRSASIAEDDVFTLAVHTPAEAGEMPFTLSDQRASGATATNTATVTVVAPEPEPTPTPTAAPSASASPTAAPTPTKEPVPVAPFRPPSGSTDDPISIQDLPAEAVPTDAPDPTAERVIPQGIAPQTLLAGLVIALLGLSAAGFFVAQSNR